MTSPSTYRAAVLVEPRRLEMQERAERALGWNEARVRVRAAGVCGTDLAIHDGHYPVPLPLVLGHEWVGTVEAVNGEKYSDLIGRRVVGEINHGCATQHPAPYCAICEAGFPTHCSQRTVTGITRRDGAFAEKLFVGGQNLRVIPDEMPEEAAIFVEPLAAALQTFVMTPVKPGDRVAVLGCGRLGVLAALVAEKLGARLAVFARRREHAAMAAQLSLSGVHIGVPDSEIPQTMKNATGGVGADVVIEATGSPDGLALALDCVRPRGTIALKSTPGVPVSRFDLTRVVVNEIRLQGSRCGSFSSAIEFWQSHRPPLERLITAGFPLERISEAIARAHQPGKVLVHCG